MLLFLHRGHLCPSMWVCAYAISHMQQINTSSTKMMLPLYQALTVPPDLRRKQRKWTAPAPSVLSVATDSRDAQNKIHKATLLVECEDVLADAEAVQDIAASFVGHTLTYVMLQQCKK